MNRWLLYFLLVVSIPASVFAAGERADFQKADKVLNDVWAELKSKLAPAEFKELQDKQRAWIAYRDYTATGPGTIPADTPEAKIKETPEYLKMAAGLMQDRVAYLKALLKDPGPDDSLTGRWSDSGGGTLEIVQRESSLYFSVSVVRGPTFHVGEIAGIGKWNWPLGFFADGGREDPKKEAWIVFQQEGRFLRLSGANTSPYHGARAYFDGEYIRTGKLDEKHAAKLVEAAKKGEVPDNEKPEEAKPASCPQK